MWAFPPRRILCPIDFGDASAAAVRIAGSLAQRFEAPLAVLHAESLDAPPYFTNEQIAALEGERKAARRRAGEYVAQFARGATNAPFTSLVVDGVPTATILHEAPSYDLVVMGTHGRRGASRWWLGSVAERVIRESPVPVLVVRAGVAASPAAVFARIVSLGGRDDAAARYALQLAQAYQGSATALPPVGPHDAVTRAGATLVAAALPPGPADSVELERVAAFIRTCERPVLFVPAAASAAA